MNVSPPVLVLTSLESLHLAFTLFPPSSAPKAPPVIAPPPVSITAFAPIVVVNVVTIVVTSAATVVLTCALTPIRTRVVSLTPRSIHTMTITLTSITMPQLTNECWGNTRVAMWYCYEYSEPPHFIFPFFLFYPLYPEPYPMLPYLTRCIYIHPMADISPPLVP